MKKRLWFLLISTILIFIILVVSFFLGNTNEKRYVGAFSIIWIAYLLIIIFAGMPKFFIAVIYGLLTSIFLILLPEYNLAFILIGALLFVLNPLSDLENVFVKKLPKQGSMISQIRGSYEPFYQYRKEVKNYYHFPQVRKLHTKPSYLRRRQAVVIVMSILAIFLLIREIELLMRILTQPFNIHAFSASTYSVILLIVLTVILYRKGFQSMVSILTISIFPPVTYSLYVTLKPAYLGFILGTIALGLGIAVAVIEYLNYMKRVVYEYYHYYDNDKQEEVFANALFEPFVYNDSFILSAKFSIKTDLHKFNKKFQNILSYSNFKRFFITAYTYNRRKDTVTIYTEFHYRDEKLIKKLNAYLEAIFEDSIKYTVTNDKDKKLYEQTFFHNYDYIVARTLYLADILKVLEIKDNVIVRMVCYFENYEDLKAMSKNYAITRMPELDLENIITVRIDTKVNNIDYVIEARIREILIDLLVNRGKYVRVSVFY